jgi:hypothetical protein
MSAAKHEGVIVVMRPAGGNLWLEMANGPLGITFQASFFMLNVFCFGAAAFKLFRFVQVRGIECNFFTRLLDAILLIRNLQIHHTDFSKVFRMNDVASAIVVGC